MRTRALSWWVICCCLVAGCDGGAASTVRDAGVVTDAVVGDSARSVPLIDGGPFVPPTCGSDVPALPASAPHLSPGVWNDVGPTQITFGHDVFTQGMAIHPCDPAILYVSVEAFSTTVASGLYRTRDAGTTWQRVGHITNPVNSGDFLDMPVRVRIDPRDPSRIYVVDGVRGGTQGFYVSHDGGDNFEIPSSFTRLQAEQGIFAYDLYDLAVDPTDFDHFLLSHHGAWGWTDTRWNASSGILESRDGGQTFIVHEPHGWGTGHAIDFLYRPDLGIGDANTWLLGTQGGGMFKTRDAGATWTQVTTTSIQHGGGSIYYTDAGVIYAAGTPTLVRSEDNGDTWTSVDLGPGAGAGFNAVIGDGTRLFTASNSYPRYLVSSETDGRTWTDLSTAVPDPSSFQSGGAVGPFEMAVDRRNHILYSASWNFGLLAWRLD